MPVKLPRTRIPGQPIPASIAGPIDDLAGLPANDPVRLRLEADDAYLRNLVVSSPIAAELRAILGNSRWTS